MRGCRVRAPSSSYIATFGVLWRDVMSMGQYLPTFRRIVVPSCFWTTLKTKALPFVETSAATGPLTRRHIPDVATRRFMLWGLHTESHDPMFSTLVSCCGGLGYKSLTTNTLLWLGSPNMARPRYCRASLRNVSIHWSFYQSELCSLVCWQCP